MKRVEFNDRQLKGILDGSITQFKVVIPKEYLNFFDYEVGDILFVVEDWRVGSWNGSSFAIDHSCAPYDTRWHEPDEPWKYDIIKNALLDELGEMEYPVTNMMYEWDKFESPLQIHDKGSMEPWMSRIHLRIKSHRVERLHMDTIKDVYAEGYSWQGTYEPPMKWYKDIWDSESNEGYKYLDNPWVITYVFERIK